MLHDPWLSVNTVEDTVSLYGMSIVARRLSIPKLLALAGFLVGTHVDLTHDRLIQRTGHVVIITQPVLPHSRTQKFLTLNVIRSPVLLHMLTLRRVIGSSIISTNTTHLQLVRGARWILHSFALATY